MRLLKIELRKLMRNRIMWITIAVYAITMVMIFVGIRFAIIEANKNTTEAANMKLLPEEIFKFPDIWHYLSFFARYIKILLAVIMVAIVTNEFTYDTLKQSVINGLTRWELVLSKFYVVLMLAVFTTLLLFLFGAISGVWATDRISWWKLTSEIHYLGKYFLMMVSFLSFVAALSFLIKRPGIVLGVVLIYTFVLEPILSMWLLKDSIGPYLPMKAMNDMIPTPPNAFSELFNIRNNTGLHPTFNIWITFAYVFVFNGISYLTIRWKDL